MNNTESTSKKLLFASLSFGILLPLSTALAQTISFPIEELGDCNSKSECKAYCDLPEHADACISFGESHGLMSADQASKARTLSKQTGPGGCTGAACKTYCDDAAQFDECKKFAEDHGLVPPHGRPPQEEPRIDEDKASRVLQESGGPGGCKTIDQCRAYCSVEEHIDECLAFAKEHALMNDGDIARAEKFAHQKGPDGCVGEACKTFCENPDHAAECIAFAEENGFIEHEEAEKVKTLMNKAGPGGCRGRECQVYCEGPAHREACMQFAIDNGLMSKEDLERMQQFEHPEGGFGAPDVFQGPGGCTNPKECGSYCESNQDECRGFRQDQGPDHPVGQERAIEKRGFEVPPGLIEECKKNPEACAQHFRDSGSFPKLLNISEEEKARMSEFIGRPEMNPSGEYPQPYGPAGNPGENYRPGKGANDQYQQQYQQQYDQEYQKQYDQQYQQQTRYQGAPSDYRPPEGTPPPSGGTYQPPPESQTFTPPASEPASGPTSSNFVASVFWIFAQLLGAR